MIWKKKMARYSKKIYQIRQQSALNYNEIFRQSVLNLMGKTDCPCELVGDAYDEFKMLPIHEDANDLSALGIFHLNKMILLFAFYDYENAKLHADSCKKYLGSILGNTGIPVYYHYSSLILLAMYNTTGKKQKYNIMRQVLKNQKKMRALARHVPGNYLHKYYLVKAEIFRVLGKDSKALDFYDRAIELIKQHQYINEEALANELHANYYIKKGKERLAYPYLKAARNCYKAWGAIAKVKVLDQKFAKILAGDIEIKKSNTLNDPDNRANLLMATGSNLSDSLDLETVIKSLQTISKEIVLEKLLQKLMKIILENAGAERGVIVLESKGDLFIEAEGYAQKTQCKVMQSLPVESNSTIPIEIINYVCRTGDYILIDDAVHDRRFFDSKYLIDKKPGSILCIPLTNQKKTMGALYLENNLTKGAFTKIRLEILIIVASQVAISIENARLYHNQSLLNQANSRFVPHEFLQHLDKESIVQIKAGDCVKKEMSVLFTDIRSFTSFSENMSPEDNFRFINAFLSRMEPAIKENHGFIDKFIGDAIMALFGGDSDHALSAGIAMLKRLNAYNQHRIFKGRIPVQVGIGINTGSLMIGTIGGQDRIDTTVISDSVNLASRIEALTKKYGVPLLISNHTFSRLRNPLNYLIRKIDSVKVKGKSEQITIYEVYDADPYEIIKGKNSTKNIFNEAIEYVEKGNIKEALNNFRKCLKENPGDKLAEYYLTSLNENKKHDSFFSFNISKKKNKFQ